MAQAQQPYQLAQFLGQRQPSRALTYEEWLAARGAGNPYAPAPTQQQPQYRSTSVKDLAVDTAKKYGQDYLEKQATNYLSGGTAASGASTGAASAATPATQAAWNAGTAGTSAVTTTGAKIAAQSAASAGADATAAQAAGELVASGGVKTIAAGAAVPQGYVAVGTAADGGTMVASSEAIATTAGSTGTPIAAMGTASWAGYLAAAYEGYKAYKDLTGSDLTDEQKTTRAQQRVGLAVADVYTAGAASAAVGLLQSNKTSAKWLRSLDKLDAKYNPFTRIGNSLWASDEFKTEGNRLKELQKKGINIPEELGLAMALKRGRTKDQLVKQEQAQIDAGQHGNTTFAASRKETDLTPEDIWGYSAFFDKYGNDWLGNKSEEERRQIAKAALDAGAVREHKGTIDIDWSKPGLENMNSNLSSSMMIPKAVKPMSNASPGMTPAIQSAMAGNPTVPVRAPLSNRGPGHWEDANGNRVTGVDPSFTMGNRWVPDSAPSSIPPITPGPQGIDPGFNKTMAVVPQGPAPIMIPRSKTLSPGIGLDGKPINYGARRR